MEQNLIDKRTEKEKFRAACMVVKIGSDAITEGATKEEPLNLALIDDVARQCSELINAGVRVAVVSSGAVACGRYLLGLDEMDMVDRQVEAAFGQPYLIKSWVEAFAKYGVKTSQVLLTEKDLDSAKLPLKRALQYGAVVINENDSVSDEEMREFLVSADNDKLGGFVAIVAEADLLALLTNVNGVLDENGNLITDGALVDENKLNGKSVKGTGGMRSKVQVSRRIQQIGKNAYIAAASEPDIILKIAKGETSGICTSFIGREDVQGGSN